MSCSVGLTALRFFGISPGGPIDSSAAATLPLALALASPFSALGFASALAFALPLAFDVSTTVPGASAEALGVSAFALPKTKNAAQYGTRELV